VTFDVSKFRQVKKRQVIKQKGFVFAQTFAALQFIEYFHYRDFILKLKLMLGLYEKKALFLQKFSIIEVYKFGSAIVKY